MRVKTGLCIGVLGVSLCMSSVYGTTGGDFVDPNVYMGSGESEAATGEGAEMTLGELVRQLQRLEREHGGDVDVVVSVWKDHKVTYGQLTVVDPPELEGDAVTLAAEPVRVEQ